GVEGGARRDAEDAEVGRRGDTEDAEGGARGDAEDAEKVARGDAEMGAHGDTESAEGHRAPSWLRGRSGRGRGVRGGACSESRPRAGEALLDCIGRRGNVRCGAATVHGSPAARPGDVRSGAGSWRAPAG